MPQPNRFIAWKNDRKSRDGQPDFTGFLNLSAELLAEIMAEADRAGSVELRMSMWKNPAKEGKKACLSGSVEPKQSSGAGTGAGTGPEREVKSDDIPF